MNDVELKFLEIESALKEMKSSYSYFPHRTSQALELIRSHLNWIEQRFSPTGITESIMSQIRGRIVYVDQDGKKCAIAMYIQNVILRPGDYDIIGIQIRFQTNTCSDSPGLIISGTSKDPVTVKFSEFPFITSYYLDNDPKRLVKWIESHEITREELSTKIEKFSLVDLGVVELHNLGLAPENKSFMSDDECKKLISEAQQKIIDKSRAAYTSPSTVRPTGSISTATVNKMHGPVPVSKESGFPISKESLIKTPACYNSSDNYYDELERFYD